MRGLLLQRHVVAYQALVLWLDSTFPDGMAELRLDATRHVEISFRYQMRNAHVSFQGLVAPGGDAANPLLDWESATEVCGKLPRFDIPAGARVDLELAPRIEILWHRARRGGEDA